MCCFQGSLEPLASIPFPWGMSCLQCPPRQCLLPSPPSQHCLAGWPAKSPLLLTALGILKDHLGGKSILNSGNRLSRCSANTAFKSQSLEPVAHRGRHRAVWKPQGLVRGPMAEGKDPNNQKFQPPVTVGLFPGACQHHLCLCHSRECCCSLPAAGEVLMEPAGLH